MRALILILSIAVVAAGQGRNTTVSAPLPAPGAAGTVTLSLSEYNRLVELATRKGTQPDEVTPEKGGSLIRQTAVFDPVGLAGLMYWYALWGIHQVVFAGMLRNIVRAAGVH